MDVRVLGLAPDYVDYAGAWALQRELHADRVAGRIDDTLLLQEHEPVFTAGKLTLPLERPVDGSTPVIDVDRGGKITWHGPGQLVGYPIVALDRPIDVVAFVRALEATMIGVCADFGIAAERVKGRSGVWVRDGVGPDRKIGAIGLRVASGVSMHGFALNCSNDLAPYDLIVPCGITDAQVTTMSIEAGREIRPADVLSATVAHLTTALAPSMAA
jgi:lipoyl(octanoyl) transferase